MSSRKHRGLVEHNDELARDQIQYLLQQQLCPDFPLWVKQYHSDNANDWDWKTYCSFTDLLTGLDHLKELNDECQIIENDIEYLTVLSELDLFEFFNQNEDHLFLDDADFLSEVEAYWDIWPYKIKETKECGDCNPGQLQVDATCKNEDQYCPLIGQNRKESYTECLPGGQLGTKLTYNGFEESSYIFQVDTRKTNHSAKVSRRLFDRGRGLEILLLELYS